MLRYERAILVLAALVIIPAMAHAQASIVGTVKDSSGAVIPGVAVEASSPVLIEKTRSVVTNGSGQYSIEDLRPGRA
jgi:Carboxypeptidase regulatory-like domain